MNKKKEIVIPTIVLLAILIVIGGVIAILNTKGWNELHNTVVKDMIINDIVNKTNETIDNNTNDNIENTSQSTNNGEGYGGDSKCNYVRPALTNGKAGKKIANMMGATVGTCS